MPAVSSILVLLAYVSQFAVVFAQTAPDAAAAANAAAVANKLRGKGGKGGKGGNNGGGNKNSGISAFCQQFGARVPPANGAQIARGQACSSTFQGLIPGNKHMVSTLISSPADGSTVNRQAAMTITLAVTNLDTGVAANLNTQFLTLPQTISRQTGNIQGFVSVMVQALPSLTDPPAARAIDFFHSFTNKAANGKLSIVVPPGTLKSTGNYRVCSMASSASGQPVVMPVAQRGAQDDCVRFTVVNGNGPTPKAGGTPSGTPGAGTTPVAGQVGKGGKGGKRGKGGKGGNGTGVVSTPGAVQTPAAGQKGNGNKGGKKGKGGKGGKKVAAGVAPGPVVAATAVPA
eukprot:jgi/Hompol1/6574/HPOL_002493-RA